VIETPFWADLLGNHALNVLRLVLVI